MYTSNFFYRIVGAFPPPPPLCGGLPPTPPLVDSLQRLGGIVNFASIQTLPFWTQRFKTL